MRGMLKLRQTEARQRLREEAERLERIESQLRQIEQEEAMSKYDVVIKSAAGSQELPPCGMSSRPCPIRDRSVAGIGGLSGDAACAILNGACFTLYHDDEFKERDWDLEVCEPIDYGARTRPTCQGADAARRECHLACTIHNGPFATIGEAYNAIGKWITDNGYRIVGPCREFYLRTAGDWQPERSRHGDGDPVPGREDIEVTAHNNQKLKSRLTNFLSGGSFQDIFSLLVMLPRM